MALQTHFEKVFQANKTNIPKKIFYTEAEKQTHDQIMQLQ